MKTLVHTEKEHIEEIIRSCDVCFVGLADTDGTPYVIPMNFGYRNGVIYLHSAQEGRSISILERNLQHRPWSGIPASRSGLQLPYAFQKRYRMG